MEYFNFALNLIIVFLLIKVLHKKEMMFNVEDIKNIKRSLVRIQSEFLSYHPDSFEYPNEDENQQ